MGISISGGVKVPQGKFSVVVLPTSPAEIAVNAVNFDGTNDFLARGGALTGAVDNDTGLISFWFDMTGGDGLTQGIVRDLSGKVRVIREASNKLRIVFLTASNTQVWAATTADTFLAAGGWVHLLISLDASANKRLVYIDDTVPTLEDVGENAGDIKWTDTEWTIGSSNVTPTQQLNGDLAELYITNEFLDLDVESNRRKFISAGGKPVDLGSDGSAPTDSAPLVFLSGDTSTWHINDGAGGGFTENGALTTASTSPSD